MSGSLKQSAVFCRYKSVCICDEDCIFLFASNNDLEKKSGKKNKKAYATAFEAVIGFIALLDKNQNTNNTDRILKEQLSNV